MGLILPLLKAVPVWAWVIAAALAWGGVQHWRARSAGETLRQQQAVSAAAETQALRTSIAETERRVAAQEEVASAARYAMDRAQRDAAAARADAGRVRDAAIAYAAGAAASGAAAVGDCKAAEATRDLFADLLGRTANRASELADLADRAQIAGRACELAYDSLRRVGP